MISTPHHKTVSSLGAGKFFLFSAVFPLLSTKQRQDEIFIEYEKPQKILGKPLKVCGKGIDRVSEVPRVLLSVGDKA